MFFRTAILTGHMHVRLLFQKLRAPQMNDLPWSYQSHMYIYDIRYLFISDSNFPINIIVSFLVQIEQGYQTIFSFCVYLQFQKILIPPPQKGFFTLEIPISCKVQIHTFLFMSLVLQDPLLPLPRKFRSFCVGGGEHGYFLELHVYNTL